MWTCTATSGHRCQCWKAPQMHLVYNFTTLPKAIVLQCKIFIFRISQLERAHPSLVSSPTTAFFYSRALITCAASLREKVRFARSLDTKNCCKTLWSEAPRRQATGWKWQSGAGARTCAHVPFPAYVTRTPPSGRRRGPAPAGFKPAAPPGAHTQSDPAGVPPTGSFGPNGCARVGN